MDSLDQYRQLIQRVLTKYALSSNTYDDIQFETVFDRASDRYLVMILGRAGTRRVHDCLLHLDIIDGKIWIHRDDTEEGIATELLGVGIPQEAIVSENRASKGHKSAELAVAEDAPGAYFVQEDTDLIDSRWDELFADSRSEELFRILAADARETAEIDLWSLEDSGL